MGRTASEKISVATNVWLVMAGNHDVSLKAKAKLMLYRTARYDSSKEGFSELINLLLRLITDRKDTPGVMGQCLPRVHIYVGVCYLVVGSPYPGCA